MVSFNKILPTLSEGGAFVGGLILNAVSKNPIASAVSAAAIAGSTASMIVNTKGFAFPLNKKNVVKAAAAAVGLVAGMAGYSNTVVAVVCVAAFARMVAVTKKRDEAALARYYATEARAQFRDDNDVDRSTDDNISIHSNRNVDLNYNPSRLRSGKIYRHSDE